MALLGCAIAWAGNDHGVASASKPSSGLSPKALPFPLEPGDVFANAPLGVKRESVTSVFKLVASSQIVTVERPATAQSVTRQLASTPVSVYRGVGIQSVTPDRLQIGQAGQLVTVTGAQLNQVATVSVMPAADVTVGALNIAPDGLSLSVVIDVSAQAVAGTRRLVLRTAGGVELPEIVPGATSILLRDHDPIIESITPSLAAPGQTVSVLVRGRNLRGLPMAKSLFSPIPTVRITPDAGLVLGTDVAANDDGTQVTFTLSIDPAAALQDRLVQIETESGLSSGTMAPANTLRLGTGPLRAYAPIVSAPIGVRRTDDSSASYSAYSLPVRVSRGPTVLAMSPTRIQVDQTTRLVLTGVALEGVTDIEILPATGLTVQSGSLAVASTEVSVDVSVAADAPRTDRRVTLLAGSSRIEVPGLLAIQDAVPEVTALVPTYLVRDGTSRVIEVQGLRLAQTTSASFTPSDGVIIESYQVTSDTRAQITVRAGTSAPLGARQVRVHGATLSSSDIASPQDTLYIVDNTQILGPIASSVVGVLRTAAPESVTRQLVGQPVTVARGAHANAVSPSVWTRGGNNALTITGFDLGAVTGVEVAPPEGVQLSGVVVAPDGRSLAAIANVTSDATPGARSVRLTTASGTVSFVPGSAGLIEIAANQVAAPTANPDTYVVAANDALIVGASQGVLSNDVDPEGSAMYAVLRTLPAHGTVNLGSDGAFTYTPTADYAGSDQFDYAAGRGNVIGNLARVTITVREPNDAVADTYRTAANQSLTVNAASGLRANDSVTTTSATVALDSQPTLGSISVSGDGSFAYTPNGQTGTDRFRYRLVDGALRSLPAEVTITIDPASQPSVPTVAIVSPSAGQVVTADMDISALVADTLPIQRVEFFVDGQSIGVDTSAPYAARWLIGGMADGSHQIKVVATNSESRSGEATRTAQVQQPDPVPPSITNVQFNGVALSDGTSITTTGVYSADVSDDRGIRSVEFRIDGTPVPGGSFTGGRFTIPLSFDAFANGAHALHLSAMDLGNNVVTISRNVTLSIPAPDAPTWTNPASGSTTQLSNLPVSGRAVPGSRVQIYVNDAPTGAPVTTNAYGNFSATAPMIEGSNQLTADATSSRGTSPRSAAIQVTYTPSVPTIALTSPAEGSVVVRTGPIAASAVDPVGITQLAFHVDGQLLGTDASAPYEALWSLDQVNDGTHQIRVVATNAAGRTSEISRDVVVQKEPPPPPPFVAPYVSEQVLATPASSFGTDAISIAARIVDRTGQPVPGVTVRLILKVNGFERKFTLVADANAEVRYRFVPQTSDQGRYAVSIVHPDEPNPAEQAAFTINRLAPTVSTVSLSAARGFPQAFPVTVKASPGDGATQVRLVALAEDQPSGALPQGISIDPGSPINLAGGASGVLNLTLASTADAVETGTVILTLLADSSGNAKRGSVRVDYRLYAPKPSLYPTPTYLNAGVRQGQQQLQVLTIENKGLIPAVDVRARLLDANQGNNVPSWVFLSSSGELGAIEVGEKKTVQLTAAPQADVPDGVYSFYLNVSSANALAGNIPVSIAVTQDGDGSVRFKAVDIFTNTLNASGQLIDGLAGATIRLQNEAVSTVRGQGVTDASGIATIGPLPAGRYSYRASAPNHVEATGRVLIQPGATIDERAFLDFSAVSVEWSVVETTVQDRYDVVLTATYQTQVPAPVVLIEPMSINLPDMQVGEEITGTLNVTNYGLIRANNVVFTPPGSDSYFRIEVMGTVPNALEAKQRVSLPYKITALAPLPGMQTLTTEQSLKAWMSGVPVTQAKSSGTCSNYQNNAQVRYDYECAAGDTRSGSAGTNINKAYGSGCSGGGGTYYNPRCNVQPGGVCGDGGGWGGPLGGTPAPTAPTCLPDCPGCQGDGGSGGGGSGPSSAPGGV
jgi:hypothetical protein